METGDESGTHRKLYDGGVHDEKVWQNEVDDVRILNRCCPLRPFFPMCTDVEFDVCGIYVAGSRTPLSPSKLVIDISKYRGEGRWPTVHNCSRLEHFPIYFGVYSSKEKNKLNHTLVS